MKQVISTLLVPTHKTGLPPDFNSGGSVFSPQIKLRHTPVILVDETTCICNRLKTRLVFHIQKRARNFSSETPMAQLSNRSGQAIEL